MSRHLLEKMLLLIGHRIEPKISHKQMIGRNCKGRKFGRVITVTKKLLIFLWIISGGLILDIAWGFGLSNTSVYRVFYQVIYAVYQSPDIGHIYFPYSDKFELQQMSDKYQEQSCAIPELHGHVMAIDGLAIRI